MTVRPPRAFSEAGTATRPLDGHLLRLDDELAQEKASALGRLGRALEAAVAKLTAFDAQTAESADMDRHKRAVLVQAAYQALWEYIVQREACGLRDARTIVRDYGVPADVQRLMGLSQR